MTEGAEAAPITEAPSAGTTSVTAAERIANATEPPSPIEEHLDPLASEATTREPQQFQPAPLRQFGYDFFASSRGFAAPTQVPVPSSYVLGPGDRIVLTLWGSIDGRYELDVDRSGEVTLPKVGTVRLWGVPFGKVQELLRKNLARIYKDFELDVNLGKLRLITVYVVGEVGSPGSYEISALSTVINALTAAGGPTKKGTLRKIQVKREGTIIETLDLYDFFLQGDKTKDVRLQDGDTVFVPLIGPVAGISGTVRKPAIYELGGSETLADLIDRAGGIIPTSYLQRIQVSRVVPNEKSTVLDLSLAPGTAEESLRERAAQIQLRDFDVVKIFPIDRTPKGYVQLEGHVLRPGVYEFHPHLRLAQLLSLGEVLPEVYTRSVEVTRLVPPDYHPELLYIDLGLALQGEQSANIELTEFDNVRVFSRWEMEQQPKVGIHGQVLKEGSFRLFDGMRVRDLVLRAGNLKDNAYRPAADLLRVQRDGAERNEQIVTVDLEAALAGDPQANLLLAPDDQLTIREAPIVPETRFSVKVSGQVRRPGSYPLSDGMRIRDLLREAGDPIPVVAYLQNAELNRIRIEDGSVTSFPVNLNLKKVFERDPEQDILLEPYDELIVRRLPNWVDETERYVVLQGEVMFPGTYPIYKGERLSSILERAGGFTDAAYLRAAKFTRLKVREEQQLRLAEVLRRAEADIAQKQADLAAVAASEEELKATQAALEGLQRSVEQLKQARAEGRMVIQLSRLEEFRGGPWDIELLGGDTLTVPQASNAVSVLGEVYNPTTIVALQGKTVEYYLNQAGGPNRDADEKAIYIIYADGSIQSREQPFGEAGMGNWFDAWGQNQFMATALKSGDTLVIPQQLEKIAWMREIKDITQILANVALSAGVLIAAGL